MSPAALVIGPWTVKAYSDDFFSSIFFLLFLRENKALNMKYALMISTWLKKHIQITFFLFPHKNNSFSP